MHNHHSTHNGVCFWFDSSMKLVDKILYEVKSVGHSLKKRIDELKRGDSVGDVVGRMYVFTEYSNDIALLMKQKQMLSKK